MEGLVANESAFMPRAALVWALVPSPLASSCVPPELSYEASADAGADGTAGSSTGGSGAESMTTAGGSGGSDVVGGTGGSRGTGGSGGAVVVDGTGGSRGTGGSGGAVVLGGTGGGGGTLAGVGSVGGSGGGAATGGSGGACENGDCCPTDPDKTEPLLCGCNVSDHDADSDGTPDCNDSCPDDPDKVEPGACGCGVGADPQCELLRDALVHRYRFEGSGSVESDAVGSADGTRIGGTPSAMGSLSLAGGTSSEYVDLPNGVISVLGDATLEVWFSWNGDTVWERVFDFGNSDAGEDLPGAGETYLFLTPSGTADTPQVEFTTAGFESAVDLTANTSIAESEVVHVALVVDGTNDTLSLYLEGAFETAAASGLALSELSDVNNWLGRSQYSADPYFGGALYEFRIYDEALPSSAIAKSYELGPDPAFLE